MSIDVLRAGWRGGAESGGSGVEICGHECVRSGLRMRWRKGDGWVERLQTVRTGEGIMRVRY